MAEPVAPDPAPSAVIGTIAAAPPPQGPAQVIVGAYINDIQELDFKANNYAVDLYVWFRWKTPGIDPAKTMEFMNRFTPTTICARRFTTRRKRCPTGASTPSSAIRAASPPNSRSRTILSTRSS